MNANTKTTAKTAAPAPEVYEAPQIEKVLDAAALQREVHYAGRLSES